MTRRNTERDYAWMRNHQHARQPRGSVAVCGTCYAYNLGCHCGPCCEANREYHRRYRKIHRPIARMRWPISQQKSPIEDSVERMKRLLMPYTLVPVEAHLVPSTDRPTQFRNQY